MDAGEGFGHFVLGLGGVEIQLKAGPESFGRSEAFGPAQAGVRGDRLGAGDDLPEAALGRADLLGQAVQGDAHGFQDRAGGREGGFAQGASGWSSTISRSLGPAPVPGWDSHIGKDVSSVQHGQFRHGHRLERREPQDPLPLEEGLRVGAQAGWHGHRGR